MLVRFILTKSGSGWQADCENKPGWIGRQFGADMAAIQAKLTPLIRAKPEVKEILYLWHQKSPTRIRLDAEVGIR